MLTVAGKNRLGGFTLIEMMIVTVILAILAAIAYPSYKNSIVKSRRVDGKSTVLDTAAMEEKHYFQFSQYTTDLELLEGCGEPSCAPSPEGYYSVSITQPCGDNSCYLITATAAGSQTDDSTCMKFMVSHTGAKTAQDNTGADSTDVCW